MSAVLGAVAVVLVGAKCALLVILSTHTNMASQPSLVLGSCTMKSIVPIYGLVLKVDVIIQQAFYCLVYSSGRVHIILDLYSHSRPEVISAY